jgi:hypothetical protein
VTLLDAATCFVAFGDVLHFGSFKLRETEGRKIGRQRAP